MGGRLRVLAAAAGCVGWVVVGASILCHAQQLPSKPVPFDSDGIEKGGMTANVSADKQTGNVSAAAKAVLTGKAYSAWSCTRAYVRWQLTYTGQQPAEATVALKYTLNPQPGDTSVDPSCGTGWTSLDVGVRVTDTASGDVLDIPIESQGYMQAVLPIAYSDNFRGRQASIKFRPGRTYHIDAPGRTYHIDAYLMASASVSADLDVSTKGPAGSASGSAGIQGSASIQGIALFTCARPWIKTVIRNVTYATRDTYDVYQRALSEATGRPYFAAGAQLDLTAGGCYDRNQSTVSIEFPNARILEIRNLPA